MKRDPLKASVLATKIIPNVSPDLAKELNLGPDMKSLALITADCKKLLRRRCQCKYEACR